eukprot:5127074-Pleurochrysis_carterae.AAC.6
MVVADGRKPMPTRARRLQGSSSSKYRYEPGENIGSELLQQYEQSLAEEAVSANEAPAREDTEIIHIEMPVVERDRLSSE